MGFLPILYAVAYFIAAFIGYFFCTVLVPRWTSAGFAVFVVILAFGACSYLGFILIFIVLGSMGETSLLHGELESVRYLAAYLLPGLLGAWVSLKALKSARNTP